jgi:hypothetical protein
MAIRPISKNSEKNSIKLTTIPCPFKPGEGYIYLRTEGVPDTVLVLGNSTILSGGTLDGDTLLAVDSGSGGKVFSHKHVLLAAASDKDTGVTVRLLFAREKNSVSY